MSHPEPPRDEEAAPAPRTILVVDDEEAAREGLALALDRDYRTLTAADGRQALEVLARECVDLMVTDLRMPGMDGLELLARARELAPELPVLVVTGYAAVDTAVDAIKAGAFDYVSKPFHLDAVRLRIARALRSTSLVLENRALKDDAWRLRGTVQLVGESKAIREVTKLLRRVADTRASVLVTGPSGTGKELVARALHAESSRKDKPFLTVNCGAIARELIGSELFGYEKGAFTGADGRRAGLFEAAEGGTVFLDEIGEIDPGLQVALLRVLQQREVTRLGSNRPVPVDFRLITATNRDLRDLVARGRFRDDLLYRIRVVEIPLPPLKDRPEDIPILAQYFLERVARREATKAEGFSPRALELLAEYPWPGNVREFENVVERAVILAQAPLLTPSSLPEEIAEPRGQDGDLVSLAEVERRYIDQVLRRVGGNRSKAARILGVDRSSLWRKLKETDGDPGPEDEG